MTDARPSRAPSSRLAIVIPIYNESAGLPELYRRVRAVIDALQPDVQCEVIYVNDGSTDSSLAVIQDQCHADRRVSVVDLSRNFGQQAALTAGLDVAEADAVIMMDGDLQDPPEVIHDLVRAWRNGADVVRAIRRSRQDRGVRRLGFDLFHSVFAWISDFPMPANVGIFGLLDRRAVEELRRLPEKNRFLPGLRAWIGFNQQSLEYDRVERTAGPPKQSLRRLARYALDGVFSFSYKPLRLMVGAGVVTSGVGFVLASVFVIKRLLGIEQAQMGFTTLVTLVLFMGGVQLVSIGLLGEYLARIYDEVKARPLFIVRRRYPDGSELSGNQAREDRTPE